MKYSYNEISKSEIIEKYEKKDNKLVIHFLDGYEYEIEYSKENEEKVLYRMLNQARDFVLNNKEPDRYTFSFYLAHVIVGTVYCKLIESAHPDFTFWEVVGTSTLYLAIYDTIKYSTYKLKDRSKRKYIDKYKRFINIYDDLIEYNNETNESLTINDLDDLSLKEVKVLERKIKNRRETYCKQILENIDKCSNLSELFKGIIYMNLDIDMEELSSKLNELPLSKVKTLDQRIINNNSKERNV